jgi:DNA-binding beta-propeller fold protein YncE
MDFRAAGLPVIAAAALLSGCVSTSSLPSQPAGQSSTSMPSIALPDLQRTLLRAQPASNLIPDFGPSPTGKWVYTAQLYGNDAQIYKQRYNGVKLSYFESLSLGLSAPQGTKATVNGYWYVANSGHSNVLVYRSTKAGPKGPIGALDDFGQIPGNVDVTADRKLVAVSNIMTMSHGPGSVSVYLGRDVEPARNLHFGHRALQGIGVAIDRHGNCYWSFNDPRRKTGAIVEFAGCDGKGSLVVSSIGFAGGLTFDQHENLYYVDQTDGIHKCNGTSHCTLFSKGFGDPVNVNFDVHGKHLWVADATGYIDAVDSSNGRIVYSTPSYGGSGEAPFGIAPAPGD